MDHVESRASLFRFVRLQVPDQMPSQTQIRGLIDFREGFLHLVFAEINLTRFGNGAHVIGGIRLGDGDQADGGGIAVRPVAGTPDTRANIRQPGTERRQVDHYFFNCSTSALACAAFGPVGAIFK